MTHLHYPHPLRSLLYPGVCTTFHWSWTEQTEEEACLSMFSVPFLEDIQHKYSSVRFMTTSRDTDRNRVGCCKPYTSVINTEGRILPAAMRRQLPFTSTAFLHVYLWINLRIWPYLWKPAMYLPVKPLRAAQPLLQQLLTSEGPNTRPNTAHPGGQVWVAPSNPISLHFHTPPATLKKALPVISRHGERHGYPLGKRLPKAFCRETPPHHKAPRWKRHPHPGAAWAHVLVEGLKQFRITAYISIPLTPTVQLFHVASP